MQRARVRGMLKARRPAMNPEMLKPQAAVGRRQLSEVLVGGGGGWTELREMRPCKPARKGMDIVHARERFGLVWAVWVRTVSWSPGPVWLPPKQGPTTIFGNVSTDSIERRTETYLQIAPNGAATVETKERGCLQSSRGGGATAAPRPTSGSACDGNIKRRHRRA